MMYITGRIALGVPCERDSKGLWNVRRADFLDEANMKLHDSQESPFKDYGIERNKMIHYHEFCTYNVADHVRAYVDMLYAGKFEEMKGLFAEAIDNAKCRVDIFMLVYGKLRHLAEFKEIDEFMTEEFASAWISYKDSVRASAEHIEKHQEEMLNLEAIQSKLGSNGLPLEEFLKV